MIKSIANDQEQQENTNKDRRHQAPASFIWGEKLDNIGPYAFHGCTSLTKRVRQPSDSAR